MVLFVVLQRGLRRQHNNIGQPDAAAADSRAHDNEPDRNNRY
jgi:hypothetical protein